LPPLPPVIAPSGLRATSGDIETVTSGVLLSDTVVKCVLLLDTDDAVLLPLDTVPSGAVADALSACVLAIGALGDSTSADCDSALLTLTGGPVYVDAQ
jgi:hypothetical protein